MNRNQTTASTSACPRYIVVANPDSLRWQAYQLDLTAFWSERGAEPEVVVVPWRDVVSLTGRLDDLPAFDAAGLVRLESPGRDFEVTKLLLAAGDPTQARDWRNLAYRKGELVRPGLLYLGFCRVLDGLRQSFAARSHLRPLASPPDVAEMFDKTLTARRLAAADIPCPPSLEPGDDADELLERIRQARWSTAYVKLNTGSSATGIAVVHAQGDPPWAVTSVLRRDGAFFNTRRLQHVQGDELRAVLRFILSEGAVVQEGIRMAQIDGQNFDVRVVMIHGRPAFTIFRLSSQPMTNLHLGGRRGTPEVCRAAVPTRAWLDAMDHCTAAARLYPDCVAVGIDLLFERGYLRYYLLEINAFGDFFPGLTDERGRSVHRVEIEETQGAYGTRP